MPSIEVNGVLGQRLEQLITGHEGALWLRLGIYPTISFSLDAPFAGGLSGRGISVPTSGSTAISGTFYFADLMEIGADDMHPLTLRDFDLDATDLFSLVSRTTSGVRVLYHPDAFVAALNAKAWVIEGSDNADVVAPSAFAALGRSDTIRALGGNDIVNAGRGNDRVFGGAGNDMLSGSSGADTVQGDGGEDRIFGGTGRDVLKGGTGADRLTGGAGNDALTGGPGADVFLFSSGSTADRITDFRDGQDHISLIGAYTLTGSAAGTTIYHDGGTILLEGVAIGLIGSNDFL